jgi:hypothetical protein
MFKLVLAALSLGLIGCVSTNEKVECTGKVRVVERVPTGEVVEGEVRTRTTVKYVNVPEGCRVDAPPHIPRYKRKQSDSLR